MGSPTGERGAGLAWMSVAATALYYLLPPFLQQHVAVQFLPQAVAYGCLLVWARRNSSPWERLGVVPRQLGVGLRWGALVGVLLGVVNVTVILKVVPWLGGDILFLRETPHARAPMALMIPWIIVLIAAFVEVNFRGFLLGRLHHWITHASVLGPRAATAVAITTSATVFSVDPFMVATFRHLHWIALWDGLLWGMMWVRLQNLYATITAHALEVIVMYTVLKTVLNP